jgi:hypothetical protein
MSRDDGTLFIEWVKEGSRIQHEIANIHGKGLPVASRRCWKEDFEAGTGIEVSNT